MKAAFSNGEGKPSRVDGGVREDQLTVESISAVGTHREAWGQSGMHQKQAQTRRA
jgi:hypothetical protein